jgi:hypothetical protein
VRAELGPCVFGLQGRFLLLMAPSSGTSFTVTNTSECRRWAMLLMPLPRAQLLHWSQKQLQAMAPLLQRRRAARPRSKTELMRLQRTPMTCQSMGMTPRQQRMEGLI